MRGLLDAHTFLWWIADDPQLSQPAHDFISDKANTLYLSVSCIVEIMIKAQIGKLPLPAAADVYVQEQMAKNGIVTLDITFAHAARIYHLPMHHKDSFDRILIAQNQVEQMPILTADTKFALYDVQTLW